MKAPATIATERLLLRPPSAADVPAIYERYASDPEVTRYVSFPRHRNLADTRAFLDWSRQQWSEWPAGPLLIFSIDRPLLLGGSGLLFKDRTRAETGYVLARDAWGRGIATEALGAMVDLAANLGVERLEAMCHPDHRPSQRVLEKCDFECDRATTRPLVFPNLDPGEEIDSLFYFRSTGVRRAGGS